MAAISRRIFCGVAHQAFVASSPLPINDALLVEYEEASVNSLTRSNAYI